LRQSGGKPKKQSCQHSLKKMRADSSDKSLLVLIDTYDASRNYVLKKEAAKDERQVSNLRP
jgi:hypothetical protein